MPSDRPAPSRGEILAWVSLGALILALTLSPITNNDIFLHLRTGASILETGRVPHLDDYSALARGRPYVAHEWLAAAIFRLVERLSGLDGLIVLKAVVALLTAACLARAALLLGAEVRIAIPALAFVLILAAARIMERPHIFSYLLAAGFLAILARRRSTGRAAPLWPLVPMQIAWTNLHGSFLMGPLLAGLAAAAEAIEGLLLGLAPATASRDRNAAAPREAARPHLREAGTLAATTLLLAASCMANPYGASLLLFPFELLGSPFMRENYEWLPPFGSDFSSTYMMRYYVIWSALGLGVLAAALVRVARRGLRPPADAFPPGGLFPLLVFAALLSLSLRMQRNVTDFALGTLPGVAATASWLLPGGSRRAARRPWLPAAALLLAALAAWFGWHGYPYRAGSRRPFGFGLGRNIPVAAADYVEESGLRGNAFNTYAAGAYLVYRFYPRVRVGMDSRNDVYGPELYHRYLRALAEPDALARMLETLDASFVFLEWSAVPSSRILEDLGHLGWRLVYFDDSIAILLRAGGPWSALAARDGYAVLDPQRYVRMMPKIGDPDRALQEAARAVRASRGAYIARVMQINALLALGRAREARDEEARILEERPPLAHVYTLLGILHLARGEASEAARLFRRALELSPAEPTAIDGLRRATGAA